MDGNESLILGLSGAIWRCRYGSTKFSGKGRYFIDEEADAGFVCQHFMVQRDIPNERRMEERVVDVDITCVETAQRL